MALVDKDPWENEKVEKYIGEIIFILNDLAN